MVKLVYKFDRSLHCEGESTTTVQFKIIFRSHTYIIREYGSTLYVGLARAVSPTNTNFRLIFY